MKNKMKQNDKEKLSDLLLLSHIPKKDIIVLESLWASTTWNGIINYIEEYANEQVIKELGRIGNYKDDGLPFIWRDNVIERMKELKRN